MWVMDLARQLAENLKKRRGKMSQDVFARKLRVSSSTLGRLENAQQNVTIKTLQQLCKALKCSVGDLFE